MAKNIYVGNLVWDCTADDLLALFQAHGTVARAQVITDRETGRSRGFGFVEMNDDGEAQKAVEALNGADFKGRPLTVNEAKPRDDRGGGGGGGGRGYGGGRGGGGGGGGGRVGFVELVLRLLHDGFDFVQFSRRDDQLLIERRRLCICFVEPAGERRKAT